MKKAAWIRFFKALLLVVPIVFFIFFMQNHLMYQDDYHSYRLHDYYKEPEDSLDVVFMGASEVFTGFSPVAAYSQDGFTSYLYSFPDMSSELYLPALKEVLSRQNPQLIMVEVHGFLKESHDSESGLRRLTENIPLSKNKVQTILQHGYGDQLSCLFPFFKYHGQWQVTPDTIQQRFEERSWRLIDSPSRLKGAMTYTAINVKSTQYPDPEDDTRLPLHPKSYAHLLEFLDYCKSNELNVVFVRFPSTIDTGSYYEEFCIANELSSIVEEHGFSYLPLHKQTEDIGLDLTYDQYDMDHMNINGQILLTEYLSSWIADEYGLIPAEQTEENAQYWDDCISYIEAYNEMAMELWESGLHRSFYEIPPIIRQLEERIASWYEGEA